LIYNYDKPTDIAVFAEDNPAYGYSLHETQKQKFRSWDTWCSLMEELSTLGRKLINA
jgi:hypothetical protein